MSNCLVSSCDEKVIVTEDICGQGIKPGGPADRAFVEKIILPYYITKNWLTRDPPKGQKYLDRTSITLLILHVQAGKRKKTRFSPSATRTRTTTVIIKTKKKRGIVSKAW